MKNIHWNKSNELISPLININIQNPSVGESFRSRQGLLTGFWSQLRVMGTLIFEMTPAAQRGTGRACNYGTYLLRDGRFEVVGMRWSRKQSQSRDSLQVEDVFRTEGKKTGSSHFSCCRFISKRRYGVCLPFQACIGHDFAFYWFDNAVLI